MEKITSFTIDHIKLQPGIYVSRKDPVGGSMITTFDIRMTSPNEEPVMNTAELHTIEHLAATFLRNHKEFGSKMIYWGPMGCRTGNYLLLNGDYESKAVGAHGGQPGFRAGGRDGRHQLAAQTAALAVNDQNVHQKSISSSRSRAMM